MLAEHADARALVPDPAGELIRFSEDQLSGMLLNHLWAWDADLKRAVPVPVEEACERERVL